MSYGKNYSRSMFAFCRKRWYYFPIFICVILVALKIMDRRAYFDVSGINVGNAVVSDSGVYFNNNLYVGFGWLSYGYEKSHLSYFSIPPKNIRVAWTDGTKVTDRTMVIEGIKSRTKSYLDPPTLLIEFDSYCNRARASWWEDNEDVPSVPFKYSPRDCSIYNDRPTPADAPPWPEDW